MKTDRVWLPDLIYVNGRFESGLALVCDDAGKILEIAQRDDGIRLKNRALLKGMLNENSQSFQSFIRGRKEHL
jgi:hypothetical protein